MRPPRPPGSGGCRCSKAGPAPGRRPPCRPNPSAPGGPTAPPRPPRLPRRRHPPGPAPAPTSAASAPPGRSPAPPSVLADPAATDTGTSTAPDTSEDPTAPSPEASAARERVLDRIRAATDDATGFAADVATE